VELNPNDPDSLAVYFIGQALAGMVARDTNVHARHPNTVAEACEQAIYVGLTMKKAWEAKLGERPTAPGARAVNLDY